MCSCLPPNVWAITVSMQDSPFSKRKTWGKITNAKHNTVVSWDHHLTRIENKPYLTYSSLNSPMSNKVWEELTFWEYISNFDPTPANNLDLVSTTDLLLYFHTMNAETCFRWLFNKGFYLQLPALEPNKLLVSWFWMVMMILGRLSDWISPGTSCGSARWVSELPRKALLVPCWGGMGDLSKAQHMAGFCSPSCFLPLIISIQTIQSQVYIIWFLINTPDLQMHSGLYPRMHQKHRQEGGKNNDSSKTVPQSVLEEHLSSAFFLGACTRAYAMWKVA